MISSNKMLLIVLLISSTSSIGCKGDTYHIKPGAPLLITGGSGVVQVSAYDADTNKLVEAGSIQIGDLVGKTVHVFDWELYLQKRTVDRASSEPVAPGDRASSVSPILENDNEQ